jgi:hypothetical protein
MPPPGAPEIVADVFPAVRKKYTEIDTRKIAINRFLSMRIFLEKVKSPTTPITTIM